VHDSQAQKDDVATSWLIILLNEMCL